jgi:sugar lactone lactonase YvrE
LEQIGPKFTFRGTIVVILAACLVAGGCGAHHGSEIADPTDLALNTPVILERVIDQGTAATRFGKLKRWIKGEGDAGTFLVRPYGVAWDENTLLITDPGSGRLWRVGAKRRPESSPRTAFESPMGVAACPEGIAVTDSVTGRVVVLDRRLQPIETIAEGLERPTGVVCAAGRVLVVETGRHRVLSFRRSPGSEDGLETVWEIENEWGTRGEDNGEFNFPAAIATDRLSVWVGDTLNFRVQQFEVGTGRIVTVFGHLGDSPGEMPRIKGLAVDSVGQLWISDAHLDQISIFGPDGRFLMFLGGTGSEAGEFVFPAGIAAHSDGRVAIVDSLNRRIQVFRVVSPVAGPGFS